MYKLGFEESEELEVNLPTLIGSWQKRQNSRKKKKKRTMSASLIRLKPFTLWITTNHGKFLEMGIPNHHSCLLRSLYVGQEATVRTRHGTTD